MSKVQSEIDIDSDDSDFYANFKMQLSTILSIIFSLLMSKQKMLLIQFIHLYMLEMVSTSYWSG
jgi:hypothetical protein